VARLPQLEAHLRIGGPVRHGAPQFGHRGRFPAGRAWFDRRGLEFLRGAVGHTLGTNLRFEDDEYNFLRERGRRGTRDAFADRDRHYGESTTDPAGTSPPAG